MISTKTTCSVTCDKCGRAIKPGETFFQISHAVASFSFDGNAITDPTQVSDVFAHLCPDDYAAGESELRSIAPLAPDTAAAAVVV